MTRLMLEGIEIRVFQPVINSIMEARLCGDVSSNKLPFSDSNLNFIQISDADFSFPFPYVEDGECESEHILTR